MIDERDPLWSSLNSLTAGMMPEERAEYLMNLVDSMKASYPSAKE
jgi:hypothetical protein